MNDLTTADLDALIQAHDRKVGEAMAARQTASAPRPEAFFAPRGYDEIAVGRLENLERARLRWIRPDLFLFVPKTDRPFGFVRHGGERVTPRTMITDGGTIPKIAGLFSSSLSPWGYLPAYLVHDWEFEAHHCGAAKSFEEVRDTMMEVIKTMMETGLVSRNTLAFSAIYAGIDSFIARNYWNRNPPACTLPPDRPE